MEPKYQLIVKVRLGIVVRDRPAPASMGAMERYKVGVGRILMAYNIINIDGVDYARLVPQNPLRPEWVRVAEADHSIEYVDVFPLDGSSDSDESGAIADALNRIADAIVGLQK